MVPAAILDHVRRDGLQHPLALDAERLRSGSAGYWAGLPGHVVGPAHNVQGLLAEELMWFLLQAFTTALKARSAPLAVIDSITPGCYLNHHPGPTACRFFD